MMKKIFLPLLLIFITQSIWAGPILMSHEEFVHLTKQEKEEVIIQTMQLIAELEDQYQHEEAKQVDTSALKKELIRLFTKLNSLLINSAHAQSVKKSWKERGDDFVRLLKKDNRCVYAGWISTVVDNVCVHPSRAGKYAKKNGKKVFVPDAEVRGAYKNAASPTCEGQGVNKIACNPVVFGFESGEKDGKLFCVNAGKGPAHNSSVECMESALEVKSGSYTPDKRIEDLANNITANKQIADGVHKYIMQACICSDKAPNMNKNYHKYMRPHRTCYGLLNTVGKTYGGECKVGENPIFKTFEELNTGMFQNLLDDLKSKKITSTRDTDVEKAYSSFITEKLPAKEVASLCGTSLPVGPVKAVGTGNDGEDIDKDETPKKYPYCELEQCTKNPDGKTSSALTCKVKVHPEEGLDPISTSFNSTSDKTTYPIDLAGLAGIPDNLKKGSVECEIKESEPEDILPCTLSFAEADGKVTATASYELKEEKLKDAPVWSPAPEEGATPTSATFKLPEGEKSISVSFSHPLATPGKKVSCEGTFPEDKDGATEDDNKPSLAIKKDTEGPKNVKVVGTIKAKEKDAEEEAEVKSAEGYTLVWYRKGASKLDLPEPELDGDEEKKEGKPLPGMASDTGEKKEEPKKKPDADKEDGAGDKVKIAEGPLNVDVPRSPKGDYQVCAELQGKDVIDGGCVTIPKIVAPMGNGMMNRGMPFRMGIGTGAAGMQ